jgi:ABC-type multidrug transport system ATPase subunit
MLIPPTPSFVMEARLLCGGPSDQDLFRDLSHGWPAGVNWIYGEEGCGKTTLLRLLAGDLQPTSGTVHRPSGGVFWVNLQKPELDETTVQACLDNLRPRYPGWQPSLLETLIDELSMRPHLNKRLNMLSTGSRRKVALLAALASGADVTLLDQPFVSLDSASIQLIKSFLIDASEHPRRAWLVADYEVPTDILLASVLEL